jgi:hypothetical protein
VLMRVIPAGMLLATNCRTEGPFLYLANVLRISDNGRPASVVASGSASQYAVRKQK